MRIAFASLGSLGDLHPLLAIARAARERGHETVIAASRGFRDYTVSLGFEFHAIRPDLEPLAGQVRHLSHPSRGPERLLREHVFPSVRETYADLSDACEGADLLVVGELLYVAPLVAAHRGIPWTNAVLSPSSFLSAIDPCVFAPVPGFHAFRHLGRLPHRLLLAFGNRLTAGWARPLADFRKELGFPPGGNPVFAAKHSPLLTLALFPAFFAPRQADWPQTVIQTGFPFFEQNPNGNSATIEAFLGSGPPPIVFTLGSSMVHIADDFYDIAARAAARLNKRAILLLGKNRRPATCPTGILAIDYAPLESVIPRAAVAVHHGGIGSCAMALRSGVPSLVIPFGYDQPDNGERLRRLGAGLTLPLKKVTPDSLVRSLARILDDAAMRSRAEQLQGRITPAEDLTRNLDILEDLVSRHRTAHS